MCRVFPRDVKGQHLHNVKPARSGDSPILSGSGFPPPIASRAGDVAVRPARTVPCARSDGWTRAHASLLSRVAWTTTGLFVAWLNLNGRSRALAGGFAPGVSVGSRFDQRSNTATTVGEWIASLAPQLTIGRGGPLATWELAGRRSYDSFSSALTPQPVTDQASAHVWSTPAEHAELGLDATYLRSKDLFVLNPGSPETSGQTELSRGAARVISSIESARYAIEATNHASKGLADGIAQDWTAALVPFRSESSRLSAGWWQRDAWIDRRRALGVRVATVGFHRDHSPDLASDLALGMADTRDLQHDTRRRDLAVSAGIVVGGLGFGLPFDAEARIAHDVATTGTAQLSRSGANASAAVRWERSLDAEGGLFTEPTLHDLVGFEVQDTLGGVTVAAVSGSIGRTTARVGSGLRIENRNASASLSRPVQSWLTAKVAYYYSNQIEYRIATPQDSKRSRVEMSLVAVLP